MGRPIGWSESDVAGGYLRDGMTGRIEDAGTGAGLFNANTNPQVVSIDPQTGAEAPLGTDMSFGAPVRRQIQTGVINGDFAQLPPLGAESVISDAADSGNAGYNGIPGWAWHPPSDGSITLQVHASASAASGYVVRATGSSAGGSYGYLEQWIAIPRSQGQQFRVMASLFANDFAPPTLVTQFYQADAATAIGSAVTTTGSTSGAETRVDVGLVPTNATYLRLQVGLWGGSGNITDIFEVRCPAIPTEVAMGLETSSAGVGPVTNSETTVISHLVPANSLVVGATYRIRVASTVTDATTAKAITHRIRVGPTLLAGAVATSIAPVTSGSASTDPTIFEAELVIRSVGAGGIGWASCKQTGNAAQPFANPTNVAVATGTFAVDTTVANYIEMTLQTGDAATSITARQATLECVRS